MKKTLMLTALVMGAASAQAQQGTPAADLYSKAQEYAVQADVAYPQAFYDRTLWKASVDSAYAAAMPQAALALLTPDHVLTPQAMAGVLHQLLCGRNP